MIRFVETLQSIRSQADAFAYMADFENAREWDPATISCERLDAGPLGVGSEYRLVSRFGKREVPLVYRVTRYEPPRLIVLEGRSSTGVLVDEITVEPAGEGSAVTYGATLEMQGLWRLATPIARRRMAALFADARDRLARVLATPT